MVGYLGEPATTERVLRGGVLHTGDMGHLDSDGYLYISGRNNEMISSGGHRIGPQEIENVISTLPGVAECAVVGVKDEMLRERIVWPAGSRRRREHGSTLRPACLPVRATEVQGAQGGALRRGAAAFGKGQAAAVRRPGATGG
jgi:acyl-CoA synthetase (AMP-forming)/AMP-acid ligase II